MFNYQITKYNPVYRDEQRRYLRDEWTAYSDIGRKYNDEIFTLEQYLEIEDKYIQAIIQFMKCNKVTSLRVTKLEKKSGPVRDTDWTQEMKNIHENIKNRILVSEEDLENICRLILREYLWCRLRNDKNMEVDFSYDYYMDIASKSRCKKTISDIEKSGLFVEEYESPY